MKIAAIIVTRNRLDQLRETIERSIREPFSHLIVVDNASSDGTDTWLREHSEPRLNIVRLDENTGGAGGFAAGLSAALSLPDQPDWCVLYDDDAAPCSGALAAFSNVVADLPSHNLGAVAAWVQTSRGETNKYNLPTRVPFRSARTTVSWLLGRFKRLPAPKLSAPPEPIDTASFVGFFVQTETVRAHGIPDKRLFISGDDTAYALSLRRAGLQNWFTSEVRFIHDAAAPQSSGATPWRSFYIARNRVLLALDHIPIWFVPLIIARMYVRLLKQSRALKGPVKSTLRANARQGIIAGLRSFKAYRSGTAPLIDLPKEKGPD